MPTNIRNAKRDQLIWIFNRMCLHYGFTPNELCKARSHFIRSLMCYPEDLICAAYTYICHHHSPQHFPAPDDFIAFMQPEFERRQQECFYG